MIACLRKVLTKQWQQITSKTYLKDCIFHTLQELATKVEIYQTIKRSKMHSLQL